MIRDTQNTSLSNINKPSTSFKETLIKNLESVFIEELLKISNSEKSENSFSGGIGEDQFSSFLRQSQAREIVEVGGIGLTKHFKGYF